MLAESYFTAYRSPNFQFLRHPSFWLAKTLLSYISGERKFASGLTLAALEGDATSMTILDFLNIKKPWDYMSATKSRYDPALLESFRGAKTLSVPNFDVVETETMLDYYKNTGMIQRFTEEEDHFMHGRSVIENRIYALSPQRPNLALQMLPRLVKETENFGTVSSVTHNAVSEEYGMNLHSAPLLRRARVYATLQKRSLNLDDSAPLDDESSLSTVNAVNDSDISKFINDEELESSETRSSDDITQMIEARLSKERSYPSDASSRRGGSKSSFARTPASAAATVSLENSWERDVVAGILAERKEEFWKRFVLHKYVSVGGGNPRALMKSVLFPLL